MASAEIIHLRKDFGHGCEAGDGYLFGLEVYEAFAEAGITGWIVLGGVEIFLVTRGAILQRHV